MNFFFRKCSVYWTKTSSGCGCRSRVATYSPESSSELSGRVSWVTMFAGKCFFCKQLARSDFGNHNSYTVGHRLGKHLIDGSHHSSYKVCILYPLIFVVFHFPSSYFVLACLLLHQFPLASLSLLGADFPFHCFFRCLLFVRLWAYSLVVISFWSIHLWFLIRIIQAVAKIAYLYELSYHCHILINAFVILLISLVEYESYVSLASPMQNYSNLSIILLSTCLSVSVAKPIPSNISSASSDYR